MRTQINELVDAIKREARKEAIDELALNMVESSEGIWKSLKERCGAKEAALAAICLVQKAAEDGYIVASKFADQEDAENVPLRITAIDEGCILIEDTGGVSIEVREEI